MNGSMPRRLRLLRAPLVLASLAVLIAGCSSAPPTTYDLSAATVARKASTRSLIVVAEPAALAVVDSDRIAVRTAAGGLAYVSGAQWADRLPKLVQSRLIQSFENAGSVGSVGRAGERLSANAQMVADIRTFEVREKSGEAVVEIAVRIINDRNGRVVAGQLFSARAPVGSINGASAAAALDQASQGVFAQIVAWAARRG
jgi:cholesterol transport system auxiliary component